MRNMLVHRGRRLTMMLPYVNPEPKLLVPPSVIVDRTELAAMLPRDPGRSEVEVMRDTRSVAGLMLSEDGANTLLRLVGTTISLVEDTSIYLADLWRRRQATPALLPQPLAQWPETTPSPSAGFNGYDPGSIHIEDSGRLLANPQLGLRMRAAALLNDQLHQWKPWTET